MVCVWILERDQNPAELGVGQVRIVRGNPVLLEGEPAVRRVVAVIDEEATVVLVIRVEGETQQTLLEEVDLDQVGDVEERLLEHLTVLDDPDRAGPLDHEQAVGAITGVGDIDRVDEPGRHLHELHLRVARQRAVR